MAPLKWGHMQIWGVLGINDVWGYINGMKGVKNEGTPTGGYLPMKLPEQSTAQI